MARATVSQTMTPLECQWIVVVQIVVVQSTMGIISRTWRPDSFVSANNNGKGGKVFRTLRFHVLIRLRLLTQSCSSRYKHKSATVEITIFLISRNGRRAYTDYADGKHKAQAHDSWPWKLEFKVYTSTLSDTTVRTKAIICNLYKCNSAIASESLFLIGMSVSGL